ncbi:MAG: hypothetical protein AAF493_03135 [Pseudomonadota bacterium]
MTDTPSRTTRPGLTRNQRTSEILVHLRSLRSSAGRRLAMGLVAVVGASSVTTPAWAHALGARYDLPLPLALYLYAGAGVVLLTFFLMLLIGRSMPRTGRRTASRTGRLCAEFRVNGLLARFIGALLRTALAAAGVFLLLLVLATSWFGVNSPTRNFAPTFVWVIWWVGLAYVAQLLVNAWVWLNPWRWLVEGIERTGFSLRGRAVGAALRELGYGPAVVAFFGFAWLELVSDMGEQPRVLGALILGYTLWMILGSVLTGAQHWLRHGDAFAVAFSVFGRFAPIGRTPDGLRFRMLGSGLVEAPIARGHMVFIVLMLSTVTFDGILETPWWAGIVDWFSQSTPLRPTLLWLREGGVDLLRLIKTLGLIVFFALFFLAYLLTSAVMRRIAAPDQSVMAVACGFAFSLVPIAIAYHVAHYYSFLLLAGQLIIPLASDPFGIGWNLFGTAHWSIDLSIVNAKTTWYVAVASIVIGHVIAVVIGHATAVSRFGGRAVQSQLPLGLLMIGYTMASLWILAQPIVESPAL